MKRQLALQICGIKNQNKIKFGCILKSKFHLVDESVVESWKSTPAFIT